MPELKERDAMICRSCGNEERASEGYPCAECGTFLCIMCNFRGVVLCKECAARASGEQGGGAPDGSTGGETPGNPGGSTGA